MGKFKDLEEALKKFSIFKFSFSRKYYNISESELLLENEEISFFNLINYILDTVNTNQYSLKEIAQEVINHTDIQDIEGNLGRFLYAMTYYISDSYKAYENFKSTKTAKDLKYIFTKILESITNGKPYNNHYIYNSLFEISTTKASDILGLYCNNKKIDISIYDNLLLKRIIASDHIDKNTINKLKLIINSKQFNPNFGIPIIDAFKANNKIAIEAILKHPKFDPSFNKNSPLKEAILNKNKNLIGIILNHKKFNKNAGSVFYENKYDADSEEKNRNIISILCNGEIKLPTYKLDLLDFAVNHSDINAIYNIVKCYKIPEDETFKKIVNKGNYCTAIKFYNSIVDNDADILKIISKTKPNEMANLLYILLKNFPNIDISFDNNQLLKRLIKKKPEIHKEKINYYSSIVLLNNKVVATALKNKDKKFINYLLKKALEGVLYPKKKKALIDIIDSKFGKDMLTKFMIKNKKYIEKACNFEFIFDNLDYKDKDLAKSVINYLYNSCINTTTSYINKPPSDKEIYDLIRALNGESNQDSNSNVLNQIAKIVNISSINVDKLINKTRKLEQVYINHNIKKIIDFFNKSEYKIQINNLDNKISLLSKSQKLCLIEYISEFIHGFGNITENGGLITMAQAVSRKKLTAWIINKDNFGYNNNKPYVNFLIACKKRIELGEKNFEEIFIIPGIHWVSGKIKVKNGIVKIAFIDSLGKNSTFGLDMKIVISALNNIFQNFDCYINNYIMQYSGAGCSVFSLDYVMHLQNIDKYVKPYNDFFDYLEKNIIYKDYGIKVCELPIYLLRTMQSRETLLNIIDKKPVIEKESKITKKKITAKDSIEKYMRWVDVSLDGKEETHKKLRNLRLKYKLSKLAYHNTNYLLKCFLDKNHTISKVKNNISMASLKQYYFNVTCKTLEYSLKNKKGILYVSDIIEYSLYGNKEEHDKFYKLTDKVLNDKSIDIQVDCRYVNKLIYSLLKENIKSKYYKEPRFTKLAINLLVNSGIETCNFKHSNLILDIVKDTKHVDKLLEFLIENSNIDTDAKFISEVITYNPTPDNIKISNTIIKSRGLHLNKEQKLIFTNRSNSKI